MRLAAGICIRPQASSPEGTVSEVPYGSLVLVLSIVKGPQEGLAKSLVLRLMDSTTLFWHFFVSCFLIDFWLILERSWAQLGSNLDSLELDSLEFNWEPSWLKIVPKMGTNRV